MRVSLSWIRRLLAVDPGIPDQALADRLSVHTCEIEALHRTGPNLEGVVVGKVLTCEKHPGADRLRCTTVDVGGPAALRVVCGAPNVAVGQTVAVATVGTTLSMPGKDGKPATITIKAAKLRGEPSEGMICAEDELGLGTAHDGIMVLPEILKPGTPLAVALGLGDAVLEVSNTAITHRADLWGQLGWAREVAAVLGLPVPAALDTGWSDDAQGWNVQIQDPGCRSYCGAVVEGVANVESPRWLRDLLEASGVRPLGLLVDVTNFVMLEIGEPMHAFDLRALPGRSVQARSARPGERLGTLDGKDHELAGDDLVISHGETALALAGVIGGTASAVAADTTAILLEAASFVPERVRRARLRHLIATDSAARFEKTVQPELCPAAINRAIALLRELCPGARVTARFHAGALAGEATTVRMDLAQVDALTGFTDGAAAARARLLSLGFVVEGLDGDATVRVPWWRRKDVSAAADLVEEAGRLAGWSRLQPEVPRLPAAAPKGNPLRSTEHRLRDALSAQGLDEVCTYVFASPAWCEALAVPEAARIALEHPPQPEWSFLRPSLLPDLLRAVAENRKSLPALACYEIGKRYGPGIGRGCDEELLAVGVVAGAGELAPFFAARDAALAALAALGHVATFRASEPGPDGTPGRCVELLVGGAVYGVASEAPRRLRELAGCPERVGWFRLDLERLVAAIGEPAPVRLAMPSRFQSVANDFTWECDEALAYGAIEQAVRCSGKGLLAGLDLSGIYRGAPYAAGRKAVTVTVTLQSLDKTLEEADILACRERILAAVAATGAVLRG